ncbi:MAG: AmmeMemoRadiSam system protein A [Candidatus Omnitrophica bacterium]|nr:AmmeMemoRadiSam system protein A [Candidatus Omnitrophota bacterium]
MLNINQKKVLIDIIRSSIKEYLKDKKRVSFEIDDEVLNRELGAFVTLKIKGSLRGCIGRVVGDMPLYKTITEMGIQAAFYDPRFPALTEKEFEEIEIEVSVLSALEKVGSPVEVKPGLHGVFLKKGFNSGLLLPQVAAEYSWDRDTFLEQTCYKAGLAKDAWKDERTEIYVFSAEVFSESEVKSE